MVLLVAALLTKHLVKEATKLGVGEAQERENGDEVAHFGVQMRKWRVYAFWPSIQEKWYKEAVKMANKADKERRVECVMLSTLLPMEPLIDKPSSKVPRMTNRENSIHPELHSCGNHHRKLNPPQPTSDERPCGSSRYSGRCWLLWLALPVRRLHPSYHWAPNWRMPSSRVEGMPRSRRRERIGRRARGEFLRSWVPRGQEVCLAEDFRGRVGSIEILTVWQISS